MKKINSIGYGGKILSIAMIFFLLIPAILKLVNLFFASWILAFCVKLSLGFGIIIAFGFCLLLAVEFYQDKQQALYYESRKKVKLCLGNGIYECQLCGNRQVNAENKYCSLCGILFEDKEDEDDKNR